MVSSFLTYKNPGEKTRREERSPMALKHNSTSPFFPAVYACVRIWGWMLKGRRKEKHKSTPKHPDFKSCACVRISIMKRPEKILFRTLTQATNKGFFPFSFFRNILPRLRVELLLSLTHPGFFVPSKREALQPSLLKTKVIRRVINLGINFKGAQVTAASHYRIPLVGNLAENKQLWRLQSHVTQLEKVRNWNFGRLH